MGSVKPYYLKNGKKMWSVRWDYYDPSTGERRQPEKRGFFYQADAKEYLVKMEAHKLKKQYPTEDITVSDYLDLWLEQHVYRNISPTAQGSYKTLIQHAKNHIGGLKLSQVTRHHIREMYIDLHKNGRMRPYNDEDGETVTGLRHTSIRRIHDTLRTAFNHAIRDGYIYTNPTKIVTLPRGPVFEPRVYDAEEMGKAINILRDEYLFMPVALTAAWALRLGEALGFCFDDANYDDDIASLRHEWVYDSINHKPYMSDTLKTDGSATTMPIEKWIKALLRAEEKRHMENRLLLGSRYADTEYNFVCRRPDGRPFHPKTYTQSFQRALKRGGLDKIRFYDLRHSVASILHAEGYSMKFIQDYLRHKDIRTTMGYYTHIFESKKKEAAAILDGIFEAK